MPSPGDPWSPAEINALLSAQSYNNLTSQSPLVSTAGVDAEIVAGSFQFVQGYAYEITWAVRLIVNGTGTNCRGSIVRFHRASSSGTLINSAGYVDADAVGTDKMNSGSFELKRTGATTTQTLSMCAQFSSVATGGTVTSMATSVTSTSPARFTIKCIGLAAAFPDAPEVPTS